MKTSFLLCSALTLSLASAAPVLGATTTVASIPALQTAINGANAGDTIILQNGSYSTSSAVTINRTGTQTAPIVIEAQTTGGVTLTGSGAIVFTSPAAWCTVQGFVFNGSGSLSIPTGTSHCRYTRNVVQLSIPTTSTVSYIQISGDDAEIDYNDLGNKNSLGEMLDISGSGSQVARRLWVHHNYFHDFSPQTGNGAETIRWGLSGLSLSEGDGICEYNLFLRCSGENEVISNKASYNTYRFNTLQDCASGGQISQRHGNYNIYYGNYVKNSSGIRIYGDNNQVFSNYFEGNDVGINIGNGDADVESGGALDSHDRPDYTVIVYNTLVNNTTQYEMNGRTGGLGATYTTFADNILQGGTTAVSISGTGPYSNPVWSNNIIWNAGSIGNIPASGYTSVNPQLAADTNGIYRLQSGSPAINAGTGSYPQVTVDMDGQPRDSSPDIGADEYSSASITAKYLTSTDVGPAADVGTTPQASAPGFIPAAGTYTGAQSVTITAAGGATIRYTTDGSTPSETAGTVYSGPVSISANATLKALAYAAGYTDSAVSSAVYTIQYTPTNLTQPSNETVATGHSVSILASATGTPAPTYQWQVSTDGGNTWTNLTNGGSYSGATTSTLTISGTSNLTGNEYRYVATNSAGSTASNAFTLTVAPALLPFPVCLAIDAASNLYVGDTSTSTISKITPAGQVSVLAGSSGNTGTSDGAGSSARFNQPGGVFSMSAGILFVSDTANATIRSIATDGTVSTFAGTAGNSGSTDGTGAAARFNHPVGIAQDASGNLYVADANNHIIRKVTSTGVVTTLAGHAGVSGSADGTGTAAFFNFPTGSAFDLKNNLVYIADTTNNTIRKITSAGAVTTLAGLAGTAGSSDGTGSGALFSQPCGLAVDSSGNIYVADKANSTIRKITPAGAVSTFAGLAGIAGLKDGTGSDAWFNQPEDVTVDAAGNVYVADTGNAAIRKISPSGAVTTLSLSSSSSSGGSSGSSGSSSSGSSSSGAGSSPAGSAGGGGGGAPSLWFYGALALLLAARHAFRTARPARK
ncbi:MAG TPA: chondroitinase-B domain-containing protein [Opitutaceae bacterium]|nr:chondroitinase-B domain-containing protein [Opitutaceae bacterium]